jgi:hypothetical protein
MSDREIMNAKGLGNPWDNDTTSPNPVTLDSGYKLEHMPDQKWHRYVSFIKSGIRILGYVFLPFNLVTATILLILSEIVGIIEELV